MPLVRFVAVQLRERVAPVRRAQRALQFIGEFQRERDVPLRQDARVDEQHLVLEMREREMADPFQQCFGVGRVEDLADRVAGALGADAGCDREQVKVVVAEDDGGAGAEIDERAQGGEGGRAAVDDVAGNPEWGVGRGGELFR